MSKHKNHPALKEFDKYFYYHQSVQSPDVDVQFFDRIYKELRGEEAITLKEDFCGTFSISCEWVKLNDKKQAVGVDLDPEPIEYGKGNYFQELNEQQKARVNIIHADVLDPKNPKANIVAASNFSYYIFKEREVLRNYFEAALKSVEKDGIFIVDCFGGTASTEPIEEETEQSDFSYFWDQDSFDPVTSGAQFYIHFKRKGEKKRKKVFSYDWRMWSIPEIREIMIEAGFKKTCVMWEGTDKNGEGDGKFKPVEKGEHCESWVAYVIGLN